MVKSKLGRPHVWKLFPKKHQPKVNNIEKESSVMTAADPPLVTTTTTKSSSAVIAGAQFKANANDAATRQDGNNKKTKSTNRKKWFGLKGGGMKLRHKKGHNNKKDETFIMTPETDGIYVDENNETHHSNHTSLFPELENEAPEELAGSGQIDDHHNSCSVIDEAEGWQAFVSDHVELETVGVEASVVTATTHSGPEFSNQGKDKIQNTTTTDPFFSNIKVIPFEKKDLFCEFQEHETAEIAESHKSAAAKNSTVDPSAIKPFAAFEDSQEDIQGFLSPEQEETMGAVPRDDAPPASYFFGSSTIAQLAFKSSADVYADPISTVKKSRSYLASNEAGSLFKSIGSISTASSMKGPATHEILLPRSLTDLSTLDGSKFADLDAALYLENEDEDTMEPSIEAQIDLSDRASNISATVSNNKVENMSVQSTTTNSGRPKMPSKHNDSTDSSGHCLVKDAHSVHTTSTESQCTPHGDVAPPKTQEQRPADTQPQDQGNVISQSTGKASPHPSENGPSPSKEEHSIIDVGRLSSALGLSPAALCIARVMLARRLQDLNADDSLAEMTARRCRSQQTANSIVMESKHRSFDSKTAVGFVDTPSVQHHGYDHTEFSEESDMPVIKADFPDEEMTHNKLDEDSDDERAAVWKKDKEILVDESASVSQQDDVLPVNASDCVSKQVDLLTVDRYATAFDASESNPKSNTPEISESDHEQDFGIEGGENTNESKPEDFRRESSESHLVQEYGIECGEDMHESKPDAFQRELSESHLGQEYGIECGPELLKTWELGQKIESSISADDQDLSNRRVNFAAPLNVRQTSWQPSTHQFIDTGLFNPIGETTPVEESEEPELLTCKFEEAPIVPLEVPPRPNDAADLVVESEGEVGTLEFCGIHEVKEGLETLPSDNGLGEVLEGIRESLSKDDISIFSESDGSHETYPEFFKQRTTEMVNRWRKSKDGRSTSDHERRKVNMNGVLDRFTGFLDCSFFSTEKPGFEEDESFISFFDEEGTYESIDSRDIEKNLEDALEWADENVLFCGGDR